MEFEFDGELWFWRGPAPWYFITVPEEDCVVLRTESTSVSYGWGMVPVAVKIGDSEWKTSLFPKDGRYVVPVKAAVRRAEGLKEGDIPSVRLTIRM
jgi:Domain of unknown function (DUF1905)